MPVSVVEAGRKSPSLAPSRLRLRSYAALGVASPAPNRMVGKHHLGVDTSLPRRPNSANANDAQGDGIYRCQAKNGLDAESPQCNKLYI